MKNNKAKERREILNKAEGRAIKEAFPVKEDMLLLRVVAEEFKPSTYNGVTITSLNSDMKITFNSGDFVKDFNDAIAEGNRIMSLGGFETNRQERSMNLFSGGMFFTSSCDDFLMDSKKYSYVYSDENPDDYNVIGVKKV